MRSSRFSFLVLGMICSENRFTLFRIMPDQHPIPPVTIDNPSADAACPESKLFPFVLPKRRIGLVESKPYYITSILHAAPRAQVNFQSFRQLLEV